ncbi:MAG: Maf family protein [Peptoanaerobacter stomatis]|uniref:Maf family protein n=1 Tax=Peptoanaerobacter stomatis TaxID=796937 RepID=UPI003FA02D42
MKLILSSSSPRRQEIMDMFDIEYIVDTTDVERTLVLTSTPHINAMVSAFMKAASVYEKNIDEEDDIVVLGADTTVTIGDYQFGKPKDDDDQFSMLKYLSGKTHDVITGYAIIKKDYKYVDYVVSKVKFKELSDETIKNYIKTEEGGDKAGSYALQGIGSIFIDSINGDYQNIIGLPISKIYDVLKTKFSLDLLDFEKFENQ